MRSIPSPQAKLLSSWLTSCKNDIYFFIEDQVKKVFFFGRSLARYIMPVCKVGANKKSAWSADFLLSAVVSESDAISALSSLATPISLAGIAEGSSFRQRGAGKFAPK